MHVMNKELLKKIDYFNFSNTESYLVNMRIINRNIFKCISDNTELVIVLDTVEGKKINLKDDIFYAIEKVIYDNFIDNNETFLVFSFELGFNGIDGLYTFIIDSIINRVKLLLENSKIPFRLNIDKIKGIDNNGGK